MGMLDRYLAYAMGRGNPFPWAGLAPLGGAARLLVQARNAAYERGLLARLDPEIPVVSVGNITLGGTNKTPTVERIARMLLGAGLRVGIVSRGYTGRTRNPRILRGDDASPRDQVGDEPLLLASRLTEAVVAVGADRLEGVRLLAREGAEVVVADDAFQHRRMGRDVDIALVDAACPFGNGRLVPAGILREPPESLRRAHFVLLTKADQVPPEELEAVRARLLAWVSPERLFTARIRVERWVRRGGEEREPAPPRGAFLAFCAIGNPASFRSLLEREGIPVVAFRRYRDHHRFGAADLAAIVAAAREAGAEGLCCTEKDLYNLPDRWESPLPLWIPRITVAIDEEPRFLSDLAERLRPRILVASNGYGEDAIGSLLARRLRERFPDAAISAFSLVGSGTAYRKEGIPVLSPPSELPSGGVVKYSLRALLKDLRHGLARDIRSQVEALRDLSSLVRSPLCVGDVYLLLLVLYGVGLVPALLATAKSVYLGGHWRVERRLLRARCLRVWTRDRDTAEELRSAGVAAFFEGNPVMDLEAEEPREASGAFPRKEPGEGAQVLLLPGSRPRAYEDIRLILGAVERIARARSCRFRLLPAATIDVARLAGSVPGWRYDPEADAILREPDAPGQIRIGVARSGLAAAAREAEVVLGLGGTANQVCAGLGVPIVSIREKGKLVQQKLLREAELLVPPEESELAEAVLRVLTDPELRSRMVEAGIRRLGGAGALPKVLEYAARELGVDVRCRVFRRMRETFGAGRPGEVPSALGEGPA